jgi:1-acyl-sn-glycerol-3-phosphate acyltransferase
VSDAWLYHLQYATRAVFQRAFRVRASGTGHVPLEGPAIIASNHESFMDPWVIAMTSPREPIRFLINDPWYRRSPVWRFVFDAYGVIPAAANDPRESIRRISGSLARAELVGIFPEGRVSPDGRVGAFRRGIASIAASTGAPVVPCALRGTREASPPPRIVPRLRPVQVAYGAPLRFDGEATASKRLAFLAAIEAAVRELRAQLDANAAASPPSYGQRSMNTTPVIMP